MAWSPPALSAGIVWVSAPGDYATFNSNHTPDGTWPGYEQSLIIVYSRSGWPSWSQNRGQTPGNQPQKRHQQIGKRAACIRSIVKQSEMSENAISMPFWR